MQQDVLKAMCALAVRLGKPLLVESIDADADIGAVLAAHCPPDHPICLHAFAGSPDVGFALLKRFTGMRLSFTASITFAKAAQIKTLAFDCPLDRLMLASSAPFHRPKWVLLC